MILQIATNPIARLIALLGCLMGIVALAGFLAARPLHAQDTPTLPPLDQRHPDAGIWVMYRGENSVADLQQPHIRGIMAYAPWNLTYVGPDEYNWFWLDRDLDFVINQVGKRAMVDITAGYCPQLDWPQWMRRQVASHQIINAEGCFPLQFWDPVYIELHQAYIRALATHLAEFDANDARPDQTDILFVRAEVMAETMENLPDIDDLHNWQWRDFSPARNGNIHQVDLTPDLIYDYQATITLTYQRELARAYAEVGLLPPTPAAKGARFWGPFPTLERFVEAGIWLTHHHANPNPQGWYYDMYSQVKRGATRGTSETGGRSPDGLLGQYAYWEILATLHYGVEFIGIYGSNRFSPELQPKGAVSDPANLAALRFGDKYAGHYRNPATSPGAWSALRGGYPEERFGDKVYFRRMWTNYEFLMRQVRPQTSVMLFGQAHTVRPMDSLTPVATRPTHRPWLTDMAGCESEFSRQACDYLWQHPNLYLGEVNGMQRYTYAPLDLGEVTYCGSQMFCTDGGEITRREPMLWARRTNGQSIGLGGSAFMRFDLDDTFAQSLGGRARVRVVYLDRGTGQWELSYDGQTGPNQSAGIVYKQDTNQWKEFVVEVTDAAFLNRQVDGADLSLYNRRDDDDIFHLVEVTRLDQAPAPVTKPLPDAPVAPAAAPPASD
jgi:hypothetical protein